MLRTAVIDRKMLAWIKEGVDETLKTVQVALDEFTRENQDTTSIKACIDPLHRVKGAIEMVGIEGAAMLASEMEQLARALADENIKLKDDATEVLAAGICQLPGYLDSLYHGHPDMPLVLLPILNDFRATQDKELFTEGDFFFPNLSVVVPIQPLHKSRVSGDISSVAKKLRPGYLAGLLGVIKGESIDENLGKISLVLENLLSASNSQKNEQLWWVALGVVDSLRDQGLESSIAIKILLGRVDREIHRIIKYGESSYIEESINKITKNLLYYIAKSESFKDRVIDIKKAFTLSSMDESAISFERESLYGFNANLIESITKQLNEELTTVKCTLDVVLHGRGGSTQGMDAVLKNFSSVADALGMLGLTRQKDLVNEQKNFLGPKISKGEILSEDDLMGVATVLLTIESSLVDLSSAMRQSNSGGEILPAEYEGSVKFVAQEILDVIKVIKEAVNEYSLDAGNIVLIADVPELLRQISGVMMAIGDEHQSNLCRAICHYFDQEVILNKTPATENSLDLLADAITGLENYYQSIMEVSVAPDLGLMVASQSIARLGYPPEQAIPLLDSHVSAEQFLAH